MTVADWIKVLTTLAIPTVLGIAFIVRLEGRQEAHERECAQRQKNGDERHATMTNDIGEIKRDVKSLLQRHS